MINFNNFILLLFCYVIIDLYSKIYFNNCVAVVILDILNRVDVCYILYLYIEVNIISIIGSWIYR